MKEKGTYFSGTSNIVVPIKQADYPPEHKGASRLTYYASLFTSVEINATFYKLPRPATVAGWSNSVPDGFRFTFKVPKSITHAANLQFHAPEAEAFAKTVAGVGNKKGCLLVQLPPKLTRDREGELEGLIETLAGEAAGWPIAVEFRHPSWYHKAVYRMLQEYGVGIVEHDLPKAPAPQVELASHFTYLRFHGPEGGYRGSYDGAFLHTQAVRIKEWIAAGKDVYAYFNNTLGAALANLQTLNRLVND